MAHLVLGIGVPHGPDFPRAVQEAGEASRTGALFREVARRLEAAAPDVLLVFDSDHLVNFFYNNVPAFCVGMVEEAEGPQESWRTMPWYKVPVNCDMARGLLRYGLNAGFDLAASEELWLDHSILVPLHFLTPRMDLPIVPLFIKGLAPPLPLARRCYALGGMVRRFIESWPGHQRVAVLASGSFANEVGGPKMGWTDQAWMSAVMGMVGQGRVRSLLRRATGERMAAAGNASGELLNWIALLGALGGTPRPVFLEPEAGHGHAYGVWEVAP